MDAAKQSAYLSSPSWANVTETLLSADSSLTERYRALFQTRSLAPSPAEAVDLIVQAFCRKSDSILLGHEAAYVLGQLGDKAAVTRLKEITGDEGEDDIVRHEAIEALAAIDEGDAIVLLSELQARTTSEPLRHTCELAVAGLQRNAGANDSDAAALPICVCQYTSRDPAKGWTDARQQDVPVAIATLADAQKPLYERYEGLFTLRNVGGAAAVKALSDILLSDQSSAVLRHEIAFVLGQMEDDVATEALISSLACSEEHGMVRHEAAIALGSVGTPAAETALRNYVADPDRLVAESCEVALDTAAYWKAWEELEARISSSAKVGD